MLDYLVLYESRTGNTRKIATEIFSVLPGISKDLNDIHEQKDLPEAKVYFVGFGVYHNTCSLEIGHFLGSLSNKKVAIFGTCGSGNSPPYCSSIEHSARIWLEDDNHYLGGFFCQGKIPLYIRKKYEFLLQNSTPSDTKFLQWQLMNFDEAMIHPTWDDCKRARQFVGSCLDKIRFSSS